MYMICMCSYMYVRVYNLYMFIHYTALRIDLASCISQHSRCFFQSIVSTTNQHSPFQHIYAWFKSPLWWISPGLLLQSPRSTGTWRSVATHQQLPEEVPPGWRNGRNWRMVKAAYVLKKGRSEAYYEEMGYFGIDVHNNANQYTCVYHIISYHIIFCINILYYIQLYYLILSYIILYYIILYFIILYCIILNFIISYHIILYYIIL